MAETNVTAVKRVFPGLLLLMVLLPFLAACEFLEAFLAPKSEPWERWQAHDPAATRTIGHSPWANFLEEYLSANRDGVNRLDYARVTPADREKLRAYIAALTALPIAEFRREEQFAYWVNLYNALTVELVLAHYPLESITDIPGGFFSFGPWDNPAAKVEGVEITLADIEHRILRPIWRDPRIHYVVNCASFGCPNLPRDPLTAANAEAKLDSAAREYINHRRGARVEGGKLVVSKIYNWFSRDFGGKPEAVLAHLRRYAGPELAKALEAIRKIDGFEYDWSLNALTAGAR